MSVETKKYTSYMNNFYPRGIPKGVAVFNAMYNKEI